MIGEQTSALELLDLPVQRLDHRDQRQHELAGPQLQVADATLGRMPELGEQPRGLLTAGVALAGQEGGQARLV